MAHNGAGSQSFKSLQQHLETYAAQTEGERQKLEKEKADLKRKENMMRETLQAKYDRKNKDLQETFDVKQKKLQESRDELAAERKDWEEEKARVKKTKAFEKVVTLDVGGTKYRTTLSTLTKYPDSMLGVMFSGRHNLLQQEDGSYFIDKDGEIFKYILMYLRDADFCFSYLHDNELRNPQNLQSPLEKPLLKQILYEAQYFQVGELEAKVRIILDPNARQLPTDLSRYNYGSPQCYDLDYGRGKLECHQYCNGDYSWKLHTARVAIKFNCGPNGLDITGKITYDSCDLSGVHFCNCHFRNGVSFEGCILRGTKFERVGGLLRHKVHFAPWQVAQADFEPELLQALKDNGCIY